MAVVDTLLCLPQARTKRVTTVLDFWSVNEFILYLTVIENKFCFVDCQNGKFAFVTVQSEISLNYLKLQVISRKLSLGCVSVFFLANY